MMIKQRRRKKGRKRKREVNGLPTSNVPLPDKVKRYGKESLGRTNWRDQAGEENA